MVFTRRTDVVPKTRMDDWSDMLRIAVAGTETPEDIAGWKQRAADIRVQRETSVTLPGQRVVYFVRFGDRVKIGHTKDLASRMASIPHDEVLGLEPGGLEIERLRQKQFRHLHVHGEWFRADPEILAFAAHLKQEHPWD